MIGQNWSALEARLSATRDEDTVILRPQSRFFSDPVTTTSESAILTLWDGQLYTVLGQPDTQGRWQLRLWWKPFVTLILAGRRTGRPGRCLVADRSLAARAA